MDRPCVLPLSSAPSLRGDPNGESGRGSLPLRRLIKRRLLGVFLARSPSLGKQANPPKAGQTARCSLRAKRIQACSPPLRSMRLLKSPDARTITGFSRRGGGLFHEGLQRRRPAPHEGERAMKARGSIARRFVARSPHEVVAGALTWPKRKSPPPLRGSRS